MIIKERNQKIADYLNQHPIKKGTTNCYKEVCELFGVNKDVIKGIIRTLEGKRKTIRAVAEIPKKSTTPDTSVSIEKDFKTGGIKIESSKDSEIKSIEDFVEANNIDLDLYDITKAKNSTWQSGENQRYSVSLELKPKESFVDEKSIDSVLEEYFKNNPVSTKLPITLSSYNKKTAVNIYLSDLHIGAFVESDALYENEYNPKVISQRLDKVISQLIFYKNTYGKFEDIFIINLGDTLDGFNHQTTRGGHFLPQNLNNKEQFETYFDLMRKFFDKIVQLDIANKINFYSVGDSNHDGDLQYIINRTLEIYLNSSYKNIQTKVFNKFMGHYEYNNHTFILTHGKDRINMKNGLPFNLNDKTENYINDYIYQHNIRTSNIHLIKGDLHQSSTQFGKRFRYKNCMSLFGGSGWSITNFGSYYAGVDVDLVGLNDNVLEDRIFFKRNF